ncbi:MAG: sigma 54-interacting transcriptional regulator [Acidobacteriota bacterium]
MPLRLVLELDGRRLRRPLVDGELVVGSDAAADLCLSHPSVSRRHARLTVTVDGVEVEDLGSSNGTRIDGSRLLRSVVAAVGQKIRFGAVEGFLEEVDGDDLEAAVRLPEMSPAVADPLPVPQSTATLAPAQGFLVGELPALLERLAAGRSRLDCAQEVGAALFRSLPCCAVEIRDQAAGLLFRGERPLEEEVPSAELLPVAVTAQGTAVEVVFFQAGVARACRTVVGSAAHLVSLAEGRRAIGERPQPVPQVSPPSPPSLDPQVVEIYQRAERVAPGRIGVLIRGESGTGKEVLARYLHDASGFSGPFVALNCAALPSDLLESELFGIEKGVATGVEARAGKFEAAHEGTLFLDEIGDMAPATQAKILRVLQEEEVFRLGGRSPRPARARVLAATHQPLEEMLQSGAFRRDLFHRIAGWEVTLPPLRRRRADIANLAVTFLAAAAASRGMRPAGISKAALAALEAYSWPGNIRQLRSEISRAALFLEDGDLLDREALGDAFQSLDGGPREGLKAVLEGVERDEICRALAAARGQVPLAAERLGLAVSTLYRRLKALGIEASNETA